MHGQMACVARVQCTFAWINMFSQRVLYEYSPCSAQTHVYMQRCRRLNSTDAAHRQRMTSSRVKSYAFEKEAVTWP